MTAPNPSTRWGRAIVQELAAGGVRTVCIAPGSRSTPLVVAAADHPDIQVRSILDERSAAYFAVGRAKRTGRPAAIVSTSGTAAANFHPAVIEADHSRTPLLVCTADRPAELHDSGANQTVRQNGLYRESVRWEPTIPAPSDDDRRERSLRATVSMGIARSRHPVPGPVHLNVPLSKPLAPTAEHADAPDSLDSDDASQRGPSVTVGTAPSEPPPDRLAALVSTIRDAERGVLVAGPTTTEEDARPLTTLASLTGFPLFADPLSGIRFGAGDRSTRTLGGYDAYLDPEVGEGWPAPDLVVRVGARPTSTNLQEFLAGHDGRHVLIDPCGGYRDPTFSTTDVIAGSPDDVIRAMIDRLAEEPSESRWQDGLWRAESRYWGLVDEQSDALPAEGRIVHDVFDRAPSGATIFVSNSMPIRDADRFGRPTETPLTVLGNRGASGIDGILSSGLGAASVGDGEAVILAGDLAFYHDMNGLLSVERCDVDATIVIVNNDGGGIFHTLPIAALDPPFTEQFKTPHGLDFAHAAKLYGLAYEQTDPDSFPATFETALAGEGPSIIDVTVDAAANHRRREEFQRVLSDRLEAGE